MYFNIVLTTFFLLVISRTSQSRASRTITTITPPACTDWGDWGNWQYCPAGHWVNKFQLKWESSQRGGDDTALDLIKLICDDGTEIYGKPENDYSSLYIFGHIYGKIYDQYGDWGTIFDCPQDQYFDAAEFRCESSQGSGDDTAGNNLRLHCSGSTWKDGDGLSWGDWTGKVYCPAGQKICGIRTKIEPCITGDDTALNKVELACCS